MKTEICELLDIEIPLLAFSHCRDVVVAVSKAGGFGVLGGSSFTPEDLEIELSWIDANVDRKPYGVDVVLPEKLDPATGIDQEALMGMVPDVNREFVSGLLAEHDVDVPADRVVEPMLGAGVTGDIGERLLEVILRHPVALLANALGVPPAFVIDGAHHAGIPVAALVGAKEHALRQVEAGVDVLVVQGTEAGGHCGEVTTMVLVPEVVRAIRDVRPVPVLAAGGIVTGEQMAAAVALGAAGAWTGSVWLTTHEAETAPWTVEKMLTATSRDTVRSKARTGKPSRQLRTSWHEAWERDDAPQPLPMPLQSLVSESSLRQVDRLAERGHEGARDLATYWVGQGVGLMNQKRSAADVVLEMAGEYADAVERLARSID